MHRHADVKGKTAERVDVQGLRPLESSVARHVAEVLAGLADIFPKGFAVEVLSPWKGRPQKQCSEVVLLATSFALTST